MIIFKFRDFSCRDPQEWIVGHPISRFLSHKNPKLLMGFLSKSYGSNYYGNGGPWNVPSQISQFQVSGLCFWGLAARKSCLSSQRWSMKYLFRSRSCVITSFIATAIKVHCQFWVLLGEFPYETPRWWEENLSPGAYHSAKNWTRLGDLSFFPSWQ